VVEVGEQEVCTRERVINAKHFPIRPLALKLTVPLPPPCQKITSPKQARFENDRTIAFVPPDGAFDLMHYRLSQNVKPLIWVECLVERPSRSRTDYVVKARSQFKERSCATNVEIALPLPPDAIAPQSRCSQVRAGGGRAHKISCVQAPI
jgi:hypothetical protein